MIPDKKNIYIIDDDDSVCRALRCLLETFEFEVSVFRSVERYISEALNDTHGVLILDIHLPGVSGLEALKWFVRLGNKRPIIVVSADTSDELLEHVLKAGAAGYFQKPVCGTALIDLINKVYTIKKD